MGWLTEKMVQFVGRVPRKWFNMAAAFVVGGVVFQLLNSIVGHNIYPNLLWLYSSDVPKPLVEFVPEKWWLHKSVGDDVWGTYDVGKNLIRLRVPNPCILKTIEHEIGHYRELLEGFSLGSNKYAKESRCLGLKRGRH